MQPPPPTYHQDASRAQEDPSQIKPKVVQFLILFAQWLTRWERKSHEQDVCAIALSIATGIRRHITTDIGGNVYIAIMTSICQQFCPPKVGGFYFIYCQVAYRFYEINKKYVSNLLDWWPSVYLVQQIPWFNWCMKENSLNLPTFSFIK